MSVSSIADCELDLKIVKINQSFRGKQVRDKKLFIKLLYMNG